MSTAADGIVESAGKSFPGGFKTPEAAFANTQTNKLGVQGTGELKPGENIPGVTTARTSPTLITPTTTEAPVSAVAEVPAPATTETVAEPTTPEDTQQAENPSELLRKKLLAEQAKLEADRTAAQPIIPTREELAKKVSPEAQKILDYWKKP